MASLRRHNRTEQPAYQQIAASAPVLAPVTGRPAFRYVAPQSASLQAEPAACRRRADQPGADRGVRWAEPVRKGRLNNGVGDNRIVPRVCEMVQDRCLLSGNDRAHLNVVMKR
jgi:hypothetical protein